MTFDPAVPLATQSPALFPAQNQANMSVLNANIGRDHQFNNTPNAIPPIAAPHKIRFKYWSFLT